LPFLPHRNERNTEGHGQRHAEKETTALDPSDGIDAMIGKRLTKSSHGGIAQGNIFQYRGDVPEQDARFREIRYRTDGGP
jgi:hypothetical protein